MPRAARAIGKMYNMTIDFQKVRDPIGGRLRNGTWIGDLGDVQRGVIDGSAWGWIYSLDRHEAADFTYAVVRYHFVLAARRPLSDDITFRNYVGQFIPRTWLFVLLLYGGFFLFLALLLSSDKGMHFTNWSLLSATSSTIFRVVLNKVSQNTSKKVACIIFIDTFFITAKHTQPKGIVSKVWRVDFLCIWNATSDCLQSNFQCLSLYQTPYYSIQYLG